MFCSALTTIAFGEEGSCDVPTQCVTSTTVGLLWELPFEVIQALQSLSHILQFKEAPGQTEVCLQVARVQGDGLEAVPEGIIVVAIPGKVEEYRLEVRPHRRDKVPTQSPFSLATSSSPLTHFRVRRQKPWKHWLSPALPPWEMEQAKEQARNPEV